MLQKTKTWPILVMIAGSFVIASCLIGYGYRVGDEAYFLRSPIHNTIEEVEREAAALRLKIHRLISGDPAAQSERLFDHLEQSLRYLRSLSRSTPYAFIETGASPAPDISAQVERLAALLETWKSIVERHNSQQLRYSQAAKLHAELAASYYDFELVVAGIEADISLMVEKGRLHFRVVQALSIGMVIMLTAAATFATHRYRRERKRDFAQLERARNELQTELEHRHKAEAALTASEQLSRTVFDNSPVAIAVTRMADNRVIEVNAAFQAASGYDKAEVVGRTFAEIPLWANPEDRETTLRTIASEGSLRDREFLFRMKDGSPRSYLLSANVVEIGAEAHILTSALDVTEIRRIDKALRESEQRLRAVLDHLPVGVWFTDETGKIVYGNPVGQKIWAGSRYVGPEQFHEFEAWWADTGIALGPDDWAVVRALRKGEASLNEVLTIKCFDGTRKTILNSATPIFDKGGQIVGVVAINEDITERRRAEERMAWLASFPALNPHPVVEVDWEGHVHYLNPAAERLIPGLVREGPAHAWLADWDTSAVRLRTDETETAAREIQVDGRWYHQSMAVVGNGSRIRIYGLDITARKQAEETLKTSHDSLETWVSERTRQLMRSNQQLKQEVEERLRTERSLLKHQVQLRKLSSALVQTEERERRRISSAIHDGIGQTLAATKIKLDAMRVSLPAKSEIVGQLDDVRRLISNAIQETRTLTFELSPPILYEIGLLPALEWLAEQFKRRYDLQIAVAGDGCDQSMAVPVRVFLFQAVRELCFNIVKHARAESASVTIRREVSGGIFCEVADNGAGFITSNHTTNGDAAMGFGLFGIREQLRHYGGTLTLVTSPGAGTRVTLRLPPQPFDGVNGGSDGENQIAAGR